MLTESMPFLVLVYQSNRPWALVLLFKGSKSLAELHVADCRSSGKSRSFRLQATGRSREYSQGCRAVQRDPVREWREHARCCLRIDFEPLPGTTFHASVKLILPELRIVRTLSPGLGFRDEDLLKDGDDSFGFIIAQSQELTVRQDARFSLGVATRR
jgi:hypothetical protein